MNGFSIRIHGDVLATVAHAKTTGFRKKFRLDTKVLFFYRLRLSLHLFINRAYFIVQHVELGSADRWHFLRFLLKLMSG
jgi:hypothetical protein